ncbi:serine/threonine-protein kinase [Sphaerotilus sulfidivorans]|uniref:serine/threonine-protein kinase n=1 Tax=Sphaerotilus sulfidivorans TaxID=639200 RepID=UPI001FD53576|nr:serine/threonine-protein kinase [Sphaerotilus sulfidivorans]
MLDERRAFVDTQVLHSPDTLEATQPLTREELAACLATPAVFRQPPVLSDTVRRQQMLGPYLLERELGRGAMGRVHLARHRDTGAVVALKTLALGREFDGFALEEARQRFQREALAACRLDHADIVRVFDSGEQDGIAYIAMERLTGQDLSQHLAPEHLLPVATVVAISRRIARALAHAHAQGIIHRDIKPANIMVDIGRNQVKVTDFGIARITDANRTRTGLVLGSPSYMSPEQLAGRPVDGRSDLYSLGVLMFQMLTGELPLKGNTMSELIGAIARTPAPDVRTLRPSLPAALAEVIGILLEKRPELRYRDGLDLAEDLKLVADTLRRPTRPASGTAASVQECAPGPATDQCRPPSHRAGGAQSHR